MKAKARGLCWACALRGLGQEAIKRQILLIGTFRAQSTEHWQCLSRAGTPVAGCGRGLK